MDKVVINFFENNNLKLKNKTLVIAVSTGIDSMTLLYTFLKLKKDYNLRLEVTHVNHMVRKESREEEAFLSNYCLENNLGFHVMHLDASNEENFQSYAREKRYQFFFDIVSKVNADYLVLAHHAVDNVETIMMRILRGSGLQGYAGIKEVIKNDNFYIIRPFINVLKTEIKNYAKQENIKFFEDSSNQSTVYTRNRIRKELIPIIFKEEENAHLKFKEFSDTLFAASIIVDEKVKEIIQSFEIGENYVQFKANYFLNLTTYLQEEVLFRVLKKYELSKKNILEIIKIISSKKKNLKVHFLDQLTIVKEYDDVKIFFYNLETPEVYIIIDEVKPYFLNDTIEIIVSKMDSNFIPSGDELWYNSNMLPVVIRSRRTGDKILLESGYKKVKDLLIDLKIGILDREKILIMEKDKEILAVIGIRKSVKLKQLENNDILIRVRSNNNG